MRCDQFMQQLRGLRVVLRLARVASLFELIKS
jgi:hypothetical protein